MKIKFTLDSDGYGGDGGCGDEEYHYGVLEIEHQYQLFVDDDFVICSENDLILDDERVQRGTAFVTFAEDFEGTVELDPFNRELMFRLPLTRSIRKALRRLNVEGQKPLELDLDIAGLEPVKGLPDAMFWDSDNDGAKVTNIPRPNMREAAAIASVRREYETGLLTGHEFDARVSQLQAA